MSEPPTDAESLQQLEMLVPLCESIRKGSEYKDALMQATVEVKKAATLPDRLEKLEPALKMLSGTPHLPRQEVLKELIELTKAGRDLEKCVDAEKLRDARFDVKNAQESLGRLEAMIAKAWASRVYSEFSPIQRLGAVLATISDAKSVGAELEGWALKVPKLAHNGPPSVACVQRFSDSKAELRERFESLQQLGIDASVRNFLIEVAAKEATLASLTPEILMWLIERKAQSRFRIELL